MKDIKTKFEHVQSITEFLQNSGLINRVDEGMHFGFKNPKLLIQQAYETLKPMVKKAFEYMKGVVAQLEHWFMVVGEGGDFLPCSTPLTMGNAWKNNLIRKSSTFVGMGKQSGKLVGTSEPFENAVNLQVYKQKTIDMWRKLYEGQELSNENMITEDAEEQFTNQLNESNQLNEVKMANQDPEALYNVIVDDDELKDEIKFHMDNDMARLMIWGAPGIGKTAILMNVIKEIEAEQGKDYSLIVKTLSNETPDNFMLPKYTDDGRADDVPKTWLPVYRPTGDMKVDAELDEKCGRGLLFIDELSRATQQVQNVILPLVNEKIFNGWKLGSGWAIICASNREEDEERGGQSVIGNALGNRFAQIYYEPTCKTWRKWADQQGFMSPLLTQWLEMPASETLAGGKYFYWDPNEDGTDDPTHIMCTPRSWTNAMRDLARRHHTGSLEGFNIFDLDEKWIKRVLNKYVPAKAVDSFWAFLQTIHSIGNFDAAVESVWHNGGAGLKISPKDLIKIGLPLAQLIMCAHKGSLPTEREFESLAKWVVSCNNEQIASYVIDSFKHVFCADVADNESNLGLTNMKEYVFIIHKLYKKQPDTWKNIHIFDAFFNAWGVNADTVPDYSKGLEMIAKKYQEAFHSAVVAGREGLG